MRLRFSKNAIRNIYYQIMAKRIKIDVTMNKSQNNFNKETESNVNMENSSISVRLDSPIKSYSDVKEYSVIRLTNGLTALLISDKSEELLEEDSMESNENSESEVSDSGDTSDSEDKMSVCNEDENESKSEAKQEKLAACALCIGVGSFSDPKEIPGLAHFLEHMIFMGSEKFPKENAFDVYIKKKGGSDNAFTECEHTTFYFDCHEAYLPGALEIFSELFVSPLMKRDSMAKEREAIESEFKMSLPSDSCRRSQLFNNLADPSNPVHKFMWGNLITLRDNVTDDELYSAVHKFRERHYSAHRMTLAIQARMPIKTLEKFVIEYFKNIPNNKLPADMFPVPASVFKPDEFSKLYIVEPVNDINKLHVTWVLPSTIKMYKTKPIAYLSWVIGHEGKGSLHSCLRKKLWSTGNTVSDGGEGVDDNSLFTLLSITFFLTKAGRKHIREILHLLFSYIKMFQDAGPQERIFKEIQIVAETRFRYAEEVSSCENVEQLSQNMHYYSSSDYICGPELYIDYDPELISSFLNKLTPSSANIMIASKVMASTENLDQVEPWFGTKYKSMQMPKEWVADWESKKSVQEFHLPEMNSFIPTDFSILAPPDTVEDFPINIVKDDLMELWYKQDVTFKLPYAFCCLNLISPLTLKTPENIAMLDLFTTIIKHELSEELYPAAVAEMEYTVDAGEKGVLISVYGFNEKLKNLLRVIVTGMKSMCNNPNLELVFSIKDELRRSYYNNLMKTGLLARDIRMSILMETYWTHVEKENALKHVSYEMFKDYICQYLENLFVQCLVQGNVSREEAIEFANVVKDGLGYKPLLPNTAPNFRVYKLPEGVNCCKVRSFYINDTNSIVTNYYQSGLGSVREECVIEFLMMLMEEPVFDILRTQQQLGYDVSCCLRNTFGILGFSITVHCQNNRNSVELVEERIKQFVIDFLETLKKITQDEFEEAKESLLKLKKCKDIHLKEEVKRNWDEIKLEEYLFDRQQKEVLIIENLTLEDVIAWFDENTGNSNKSKVKMLSTQVVGISTNKSDNNKTCNCSDETDLTSVKLSFLPQSNTCDKYIYDMKEFKKPLYLYPAHKIAN